jgi:hypothetical protein
MKKEQGKKIEELHLKKKALCRDKLKLSSEQWNTPSFSSIRRRELI